jgi:hypothetical protein
MVTIRTEATALSTAPAVFCKNPMHRGVIRKSPVTFHSKMALAGAKRAEAVDLEKYV